MDQLTPACPYTAMVLSHGMLLKLIYIYPLDETSLLLSMSHKGTKCENSYWPIFICVVYDGFRKECTQLPVRSHHQDGKSGLVL